MLTTDEVLVEDWQGLESEFERLFMIYGYPVNDLHHALEQEETKTNAVGDIVVPRNETTD